MESVLLEMSLPLNDKIQWENEVTIEEWKRMA